MKKSIILILLAAICLPGYSRKPKKHYRPTDAEYIELINERATSTFDRTDDDIAFQYYRAVVLWEDLLQWDAISAEEYALLCKGDPMPFVDRSDYDEYTYYSYFGNASHQSAITWFRRMFPNEYLRICDAHEQLTKRIYGIQSKEYISAAYYYLDALSATCPTDEAGAAITRQKMERAKELCTDVLTYSPLQEDRSKYYEWMMNSYKCRLSLEGASENLQKEIDQTAKAVEETQDMTLIEQFSNLRTECALLMKNYNYAIQIQEKVLQKTTNPYRSIAPMISMMRTYVLAEDYENANRYLKLAFDIMSGGDHDLLKEDNIGKEMQGDWCNFSQDDVFPYLVTLRKQYNQRIFEHYGYRNAEDLY